MKITLDEKTAFLRRFFILNDSNAQKLHAKKIAKLTSQKLYIFTNFI